MVVLKVDRAILTAVDFLDENTKVSMYEFEINEVVQHALGVYSQTQFLFELGHKTSLNMLQADTQEWSLAQIYSLIQDSELNVHPVNVHRVGQNWKQIKQNFKAHVLQRESFIKLQLQRDLSEKRSKDQAIMKSASVAVDAVQIIPVLTLDHCGLFCGTESSEARTTGNQRRLLQADAEFVTVCGKYGDAERVNVDIKVKTQDSTTVFTSHDVTLIDVSNNTIQKWDVLGLSQWVLGQPGYGCSDTCSSAPAQDGVVTNARFTCVESFPFLSSYYANQIIRQITGQSCLNACSSSSCDNLHWTPALFDDPASFQCMHMTSYSFSTCSHAQPGWRRLCPCGLPAFCPVNHYYDQSNPTLCVSCPSGKYTESIIGESNIGIESCSCDVGYEERLIDGEVKCEKCSPGTTKLIKGSSSCVSCESGKFALQDGSVDENECIQRDACQPGQYRITPTQCSSCVAGKFSNVLDATECSTCPSGKIAPNPGTQTCSACTAGFYSSLDKTQCISCGGTGITSSPGSDSESDCVCEAGYEPRDGVSNICQACSSGEYKSSTGNVACLSCSYAQCTGGNYLAGCGSTNAGSCTSCPNGKIKANVNDCSACDPGKKEVGHVTCENCEAGTFSGYQASVCSDCGTGTYSLAGANACTNCPAGKYSTILAAPSEASCTACNTNSYSSAGATVCTSCSVAEASCTGSTSGGLIGNYLTGCGGSSAGTCQSCGVCAQNQYKNDCSGSSPGTCQLCGSGKYSDGRYTSCFSCAAGKYRTSSMNSCTQCEFGKIQPATGQSSCNTCTETYHTNNADYTACVWPCQLGYYLVKTATQHSCSACSAGSYGTADIASQAQCTQCATGTYTTSTGSSSASDCVACQAGKYLASGTSQCSSCPAGTYSANAGATVCTTCGVGNYSTTSDSTVCSICPEGKFANTSRTTCHQCEEGTASPGGTDSCTICPAGKVAYPYFIWRECYDCGVGSYSHEKSVMCLNCPAGKYGPSVSNAACTDCAANHKSGEWFSSCRSCSRGEVFYVKGTTNTNGMPQGSKWNRCTSCSNYCSTSVGHDALANTYYWEISPQYYTTMHYFYRNCYSTPFPATRWTMSSSTTGSHVGWAHWGDPVNRADPATDAFLTELNNYWSGSDIRDECKDRKIYNCIGSSC